MTERAALWVAVGLVAALSSFAIVLIIDTQRHQNDALSALMCHGEHFVRSTAKGLTAVQRRQALRFYERQIRIEHLKLCPKRKGNK